MPIKPENKSKYPKNWKAISSRIRFERANNACERCGVKNYAIVKKQNNCHRGVILMPYSYKVIKGVSDSLNDVYGGNSKFAVVVLTVAHLDHNPANNNEDNLMALCQECHNRHDAKHRSEKRFKNK